MAKITTDHLQLDHAAFDLAVALQGAGQAVMALAEQKGLKLTVVPLALETPRVLGDAYRLHQVLLNLLSNALKFTEQGQVQLGAQVLNDQPDAVTIRFWVQDTGIGIAPEQQASIFEAFTQASAETSRRFGGTGLGLAISQQLVHHMGGTLRVCSAPDYGSTFSFTLTLPRILEALPEAMPQVVTYEGLRGLRVLLAEDNLVNQWLVIVMLEHWGVLVQAVVNGPEALDYLRTQAYDVAILDIQMPGLSGVEVTTAIRQHPDAKRASVPVVALTANAFQADRESYLAAGMNACLTKPFEEADLCETLLRLTVGWAEASGK
jgi:CheY-like chemotaxis protein